MGIGMDIQEMTPKLDAQTSTNLIFTLPNQLVFWSVAPANWPVTPTPNLILHIENLSPIVSEVFSNLLGGNDDSMGQLQGGDEASSHRNDDNMTF